VLQNNPQQTLRLMVATRAWELQSAQAHVRPPVGLMPCRVYSCGESRPMCGKQAQHTNWTRHWKINIQQHYSCNPGHLHGQLCDCRLLQAASKTWVAAIHWQRSQPIRVSGQCSGPSKGPRPGDSNKSICSMRQLTQTQRAASW
jgi:hypothetical protein